VHSPLLRITQLLKDAGIPMDGIRDLGTGNYQVIWLPTATPAQKLQAAQIVANADKTPRRARKYVDIMTELAALPQADLNKLMLLMMAGWLIDNPDIAEKVSVAVNGDEPDV
jgi:hypothetical protein